MVRNMTGGQSVFKARGGMMAERGWLGGEPKEPKRGRPTSSDE
jgi:hypothetical protein